MTKERILQIARKWNISQYNGSLEAIEEAVNEEAATFLAPDTFEQDSAEASDTHINPQTGE